MGACMAVSPEVREVAWLDVADIVASFLRSKGKTFQPVNAFQQSEFARYGITERDPMYASMGLLNILEACGSLAGIRAAAKEFDGEMSATAEQEARTQRWAQ